MPVHLPSHLYRNRHGTFYFRLVIPAALRETAQRREIHASLGTERRQEAIIRALPYIEAIPRLLSELQTMTDEKKKADQRYFQEWMSAVKKNMQQVVQIEALESEIFELRAQLARSVPRDKAEDVVRNTYTVGQLRGKQELESRLVFPWPAEKTVPFSQLLERYLASFTYRAKGGAKKPPTEKTMQSYRADISFFTRVMTDLRIGAIDKEIAGQYFNILRRLPPNLNKNARYKDKTIDEILALGDQPQSEDNASKKMERTSSMFTWALSEKKTWGIDANPFTGFGQADDKETARRPFTLDEIRQLLQHTSYTKRHFRTLHSFWLIPLAVFTGARLGELCQLALRDFIEVEGIHCIDINDTKVDEESKRRLKNKNAKRLVPIHPELIRMGLLRYVAQQRKNRGIYLFNDLGRGHRDGPAHPASKWFAGFRAAAGLQEKQATVFHSFRHLFITNILDSGVSPHLLAPVVGHEAELVTGKVYWNKRDAKMRKPTVDTFTLPDDILAMFPNIEDVTFTKRKGMPPSKKAANSA